MVIFLRGKAATGKSTVAKALKREKDIRLIDKDTIFDNLLAQGITWHEANRSVYDALAVTIQKAHDEEKNIIVDVGLAHVPYFMTFRGKMSLDSDKCHYFLFECKNETIWQERLESRIKNPQGLNQIFTSYEAARLHYNQYDIAPIEGEIVIDTSDSNMTIQNIVDNYFSFL